MGKNKRRRSRAVWVFLIGMYTAFAAGACAIATQWFALRAVACVAITLLLFLAVVGYAAWVNRAAVNQP